MVRGESDPCPLLGKRNSVIVRRSGHGAVWEAVGSGGRGTIAGQDDVGSARGCFGRPCGRKDSAVVCAISGRAKIPFAAAKRLARVARPLNATAGDARGGKG
jgi:hypothetical protein